MPLEIEAKVKIEPCEVRPILSAIWNLTGNTPVVMKEQNEFFDMKSRLRKRGKVLRLRTVEYAEHDYASTHKNERYFVTYKGPLLEGPMKAREEVEVEVNSYQAKFLLTQIGFKPTFSFEKLRKEFDHDGCHITMDEVPLIGHFVEVEGANVSVVKSVLRRLGLHKRKCVKDGYPSLLRKHFASNHWKGRPLKAVTF